MILSRVEIKNFRSIKKQTIIFNRNLLIMVGINESGKSNIIKALSLLDYEVDPVENDIRVPTHDEDTVEVAYVRFVFEVDRPTVNKAFKSFSNVILGNSKAPKFMSHGRKGYTLEEFFHHCNTYTYEIDVLTGARSPIFIPLEPENWKVGKEWKKINSNSEETILHGGIAKNLNKYNILHIKEWPNLPDGSIQDLDVAQVEEYVRNAITIEAMQLLPTSILWKYDEENLLPAEVDYDDFVANPDSCVPLKNMFALAGHTDAGVSLNSAAKKTFGIKNLLERVSTNTTKHMRTVWPDWKKESIELRLNGEIIEAGIKDEYNTYALLSRSDGFKRFFAFLLMISTQNQTQNIRNNLLLIDEPDLGLHPKGIKYLLKELKKISQNNYLLIATHSIFMVDKEIIDRHLIVEKRGEVTQVQKVRESNITDEEVIFNALDYSLYELMKERNIIFEGWRDKRIFSMFLKTRLFKLIPKTFKIKDIGLLHALGVKDVPRLANLLRNFGRRYIIITDSDRIAYEKKKEAEKEGECDWTCMKEIDSVFAITVEDMVSNILINKAVKYALKQRQVKTIINLPESIRTDKIKYIAAQVDTLSLSSDMHRIIMSDIKQRICETVGAKDLTAEYELMVKYLLNKIALMVTIECDGENDNPS